MALRFAETRSGRMPFLARICIVLAALSVLATPVQARHWRHYRVYASHQAAPARDPAFAAIVVDANSGRTLYAASESEPRHPASLTKVMTLYLLFEQLEKGRLSLDSPISMSAHAASQAPSKLGLEPGETICVENAIKAIVTRSANDVAVAIAETIGGDEESFAQMMTRKAHALGMAHTTYVNASGLPDDRQLTTARDLTLLGRAVQERFPHYFRYFSTQSFDYAGETIGNHNHLLGRVDGVDGIKTGYTRASGFNLLTSVHRGGRSLVAVVMGGPTAGARDRFMESLIAQHIASAATIHSATMIADAAAPAATPPAPPVRSAELAPGDSAAPTPPVRVSVAQLSSEDAEGDGDNVERDPPAPTLEATRHLVKRDIRVAPALAVAPPAAPPPPAPPVRVADSSPAALGWVKGPDGVAPPAEPKAVPLAKAIAAPVLPPAPTRQAEASPAALGWIKGPDGVAPPAEPTAGLPAKGIVAVAHAKEETHVARSQDARPPGRDGWQIQIGATEDAGKANDLLIRAKAQNRSTLASAKPFTEKIEKGNGAFYRARFAGLDSSSTAEAACKTLKRTGFSCFATHE
jgi:D-alanyl-D-alanine carboxypeptidase